MKKSGLILLLLIVAMAMAACGSNTESANLGNLGDVSADDPAATENSGSDAESIPNVDVAEEESIAENASAGAELNTDYTDALPIQAQLAFGTIQLEETELAVTEEQAAQLLPLWQAMNSLVNSGTAADVEIEAVLKQIEGTMTPAQISEIAAMELTAESLANLGGGFARGFLGGPAGGAGEADGFGPGGEFVAGEGPGGPGGFIGGGPGGGPGGIPGGFGPGGGLGPGGAELDEDTLATRQAEFAAGDTGAIADRAALNVVVGFLDTKVNGITVNSINGFFQAMAIISETLAIPLEDLQNELGTGKTLAEVIADHDGDLEAVQEAIMAAFAEFNLPDGTDLETYSNDLLNSGMPALPEDLPEE